MRVGLTGGVASGKSTVSTMLRELGAVVIDADLLARQVVAPGTAGLASIVDAFGPEVLAPDGSLDRAAMGTIVFADEGKRRLLESIVHPLVRAAGAELESAAPAGALVVHDIPLLFETGQAGRFDAVLVVEVPPQTQLDRMVTLRGMSQAEATARLAAQATREQRLSIATYVLDNAGTLEDLRDRVTEVFDDLTGGTGGSGR